MIGVIGSPTYEGSRFKIGDRVMARIHRNDAMEPATIVDPRDWSYIDTTTCYAVEFDRRPVGSAGTYNARRVSVSQWNVKALCSVRLAA